MHRWVIPTTWLLAAALSAHSASTRPADPRPLPPQIENQRRVFQARPLAGKYKLADLLTLSLEAGRIKGTINPAARQAPGEKRIEIEGLGGDWLMMYTQIRGPAAPADYLRLMRYDFEEARSGGIWSTSLYLHSSGTVSMVGNIGDARRSVMLSMTNAGVRLMVRDLNVAPPAAAVAVNFTAPTIEELRSRCPKEVRQYVRPMLAKFLGPKALMVKAADAYRAFPQIRADAATMRRLEQLLPQLDAPLAEQRDRASAALADLGEPAVLAALRMDRSHLTPEQSARLDAFIAKHDDHRFADVQTARRNVGFLIECLESDDRAVRAAARETLAAATGRAIDFDIGAGPEARAQAADGLWEALAKPDPHPPTTAPAPWQGPVN